MASLTVATFNIRNGRALDGRRSWPLRRAAVAAAIVALDADVLALQEVYAFQRRYLAGRTPDRRWAGEGRNGGSRGEQCALVHRPARLDLVSHMTRWFGDVTDRPSRMPGARFPRTATFGTYRDRIGGRFLVVVDTHLDERHTELRRRSVEQLVGWLSPGVPTVVMGDLNTDDVAILAPLVCHGLVPALPPDAPGTAHAFRGGVDGQRLDHVFVSSDFDVVEARVLLERPGNRLPSDHWPVRVELAWTSA